MAIALKYGANGNLAQMLAADSLDAQSIEPRNVAADMTIGSNLNSGQKVILGNANADTQVLRDLLLARDILPGAGVGSLGSSTSQYVDEAWVAAVSGGTGGSAAYNLNATGSGVAGAYSIGVDPATIPNVTNADLQGALVQLGTAISGSSGDVVQLPPEDTLTINQGDCVGQSLTTSGRVALSNAVAGASQNPSFIGIAQDTVTGNAGGTNLSSIKLIGTETIPTETYSAGSALYIPVGGGHPTETAPSATGQLIRRVGWANTTTVMLLDPGTGVVLA
jgi:hypothetical protein